MDNSICRRNCENEHLILSPYASFADKSRGRMKQEEACPIRTVFQRDRDRIIHSSAFRRLKHKTQVFLSPEGDYFRTRLTHTLEVTQIARTISRSLKLNEDLTEAIALGHDLGHTPFGHAGERALNSVCEGGFRHFDQSVRVVDVLEKSGKGLNLTDEVRNGIHCHTRGEEAYTLEGRVVKIADKIAYLNHDIDDAIRANIITENNIPLEIRETLGFNKSSRINTLVRSVIENSENKNEILLDKEIKEAFDALNDFMFKQVYTNPACKGEESKAIDMIIRMYYYFADNPDKLTNEFYDIRIKEGSKKAATDYIAGMTDRYAVSKFRELFIPKSWYSY